MTARLVGPVVNVLLAVAVATSAPVVAAAQESSVTILTPGGTVLGGAETVKIAWCSYGTGTGHFDVSTHTIKANNVDVTADFDLVWDPAACNAVAPYADEFYSSTGTVAVDPVTGQVAVLADAVNEFNYHWQAYETYDPAAPRRAVPCA